MRRILTVIPVVLATMLLFVALPSFAGNPHFVVAPDCVRTSSTTLTCSGKIAGLGSSPIYLVIYAPAGCTTPSGSNNPPGQQSFITGPFNPSNGQFTFGPGTGNNVTATARGCPGNQTPFIQDNNVRIDVYECTSGAPRFNSKTGAQTNSSCTLVLSSPA